jgi:hypothetical protein
MSYTIVGWCNECEAYETPFQPNTACGGDHPERPNGDIRPWGFMKILRKRRMYICPNSGCEGMGFFKFRDYREHLQEHIEWLEDSKP